MSDGTKYIYLYQMALNTGFRSLAENSVQGLKDHGIPCEDFMSLFDDIWTDVDTSEEAALERAARLYG